MSLMIIIPLVSVVVSVVMISLVSSADSELDAPSLHVLLVVRVQNSISQTVLEFLYVIDDHYTIGFCCGISSHDIACFICRTKFNNVLFTLNIHVYCDYRDITNC